MRMVTKQPQQPRTVGRKCAAMAFRSYGWVQQEPAFRYDCLLSVACPHIISYKLRHAQFRVSTALLGPKASTRSTTRATPRSWGFISL
jgi:hypothetical protein